MHSKIAVVAGALGVAGRALLQELESRPEWKIIGLSRRSPDFATRAQFASVDLTDGAATVRCISKLPPITHVFFAAYTPAPTLAEEVAPNLSMLSNLVGAIDEISKTLQHVALIQGSKWYGNHLGPYKTPAREDDPRHMPPNFYYDQQDWLQTYQAGKSWTWSAWRPHGLCGLSIGSAMNQLNALGIYATISRELGLPLRFPGSPEAYRSVYQFTDGRLLARALLWGSAQAACANQAFNITNGDYDRWENIWPAIAKQFDLTVGPVQSLSLARFMADKEILWAKIRERHRLRPYALDQLVNWNFADWVYSSSFDQMSSLSKIRQAGWTEVLEPAHMFERLFATMRAERFLP